MVRNGTSGRLRFESCTGLALEAAFDGGRLTSDGGLPLLQKVDNELGICDALAAQITEWRSRRPRHALGAAGLRRHR